MGFPWRMSWVLVSLGRVSAGLRKRQAVGPSKCDVIGVAQCVSLSIGARWCGYWFDWDWCKVRPGFQWPGFSFFISFFRMPPSAPVSRPIRRISSIPKRSKRMAKLRFPSALAASEIFGLGGLFICRNATHCISHKSTQLVENKEFQSTYLDWLNTGVARGT